MGLESGIRKKPIPYPRVKKATDPGSGSATLQKNYKRKLLSENKTATSPITEEGRAAVKVLIKNLAIFFLCPNKQFLPIPLQIQLLEYIPQKQKEQRQKPLGYY
jgi:hypothetical protein